MKLRIAMFGLLLSCAGFASENKIDTLTQWQAEVANTEFSGVIIAAQNGQVVFREQYGYANREAKRLFTHDTVFDIGSITKQFVGTAITQLAEQNKLQLDSSLEVFFEQVPEDKKHITVHHLLTHTSGLSQNLEHYLYDEVTKSDMIKQALTSKLNTSPGEQYRYSNIGYNLLGAIIEKVTGDEWEKYIRTTLLLPAGLENTGFRGVSYQPISLAINYGRDANFIQRMFSITPKTRSVDHSLAHYYKKPGPRWAMEGAGSFMSNTNDMFKWYLALREGKLISAKSWQLITSKHIHENDAQTSHYGYGWAIDSNSRGDKRITHNGSNGYSFAVFNYYPELDGFVFIGSNNIDDFPEQLMAKLDELVIKPVIN